MIADVKRGRGAAGQAGTAALSLLAAPINVAVLKALGDGDMSLSDLRRAAASPPQTTMRAYLKILEDTGLVERERRNSFPGNVHYRLARFGHECLAVADVVDNWLNNSPNGPMALGSGAGKSAIKALIEAWSTSMVRALAACPLSLTELDAVIPSLSYPSLERRLTALRTEGLVEGMQVERRGTPYRPSEWLREGIAPLIASSDWERRHLRHAAPPITNHDVEAAFLLALPLLRLSRPSTGTCRLTVQLRKKEGTGLAGVVASVREGTIVACRTRLGEPADAWAFGPPDAWFSALLRQDTRALEVGGDLQLAAEIVGALHGTLFALSPH